MHFARLCLGWLCALTVSVAIAGEAADRPRALLLEVHGVINPGMADYISQGLRRAASEQMQLVVLRMDTPGGLDTSTRAIVQDILASPVPVATYVAPEGSRAASAGTYILYASHIAAMAPATNLGAATPITIGGGTKEKKTEDEDAGAAAEKRINDAAAYIRSLADLRGRNAQWADRAVREAVSLTAGEALDLEVIDIVAPSLSHLLAAVDGRTVRVQNAEQPLATKNAQLIELQPNWRAKLLIVITDPGIAMIMMMIGIYGLLFELASPGMVLPGVLGAISLLLALFALHLLPINYAGLALIGLGISFAAAEAFVPSFGALGIGGIAAVIMGSLILFDPQSPIALPPGLVAAISLTTAALTFVTALAAARTRKLKTITGSQQLVNADAVALEDFERHGWAHVRGETWRVSSTAPVKRNQRLRVVGVSGLTLRVEPESQGVGP